MRGGGRKGGCWYPTGGVYGMGVKVIDDDRKDIEQVDDSWMMSSAFQL